jgi:hypothetical protein
MLGAETAAKLQGQEISQAEQLFGHATANDAAAVQGSAAAGNIGLGQGGMASTMLNASTNELSGGIAQQNQNLNAQNATNNSINQFGNALSGIVGNGGNSNNSSDSGSSFWG